MKLLFTALFLILSPLSSTQIAFANAARVPGNIEFGQIDPVVGVKIQPYYVNLTGPLDYGPNQVWEIGVEMLDAKEHAILRMSDSVQSYTADPRKGGKAVYNFGRQDVYHRIVNGTLEEAQGNIPCPGGDFAACANADQLAQLDHLRKFMSNAANCPVSLMFSNAKPSMIIQAFTPCPDNP